MSIYTRTGDKGRTSLFGGKRVLKSDERVDTYGTIDELNSVIGLVCAQFGKSERKLKQELEHIQHDLFAIGASLANPDAEALPWLTTRVKAFEALIDTQTKMLPELHNFILPGGSITGAMLHQARTICRRAERRLVALDQKVTIEPELITYINRLSDVLFSTARMVNHRQKKKETIWQKDLPGE